MLVQTPLGFAAADRSATALTVNAHAAVVLAIVNRAAARADPIVIAGAAQAVTAWLAIVSIATETTVSAQQAIPRRKHAVVTLQKL